MTTLTWAEDTSPGTGELIDVGAGCTIEWIEAGGSRVGYYFLHPLESSPTGRCGGVGWTDPAHNVESPHWAIVMEEPLTLAPSLLCHCGFHGWIQAGRWVQA